MENLEVILCGKFIFGKSLIQKNGMLHFPEQAIQEYDITVEGRVYLFTGSKSTGGFCVTRKGLLEPSQLGHILADNPTLRDYTAKQGEFIKYKGRSYSWVDITNDGRIVLTNEMMSILKIEPGMKLLSIRSSDIAFTMGAYGQPACYFEEGEKQLLVSPGALDMAGIIVTPREKDFLQITAEDIENIIREVGLPFDEANQIVENIQSQEP